MGRAFKSLQYRQVNKVVADINLEELQLQCDLLHAGLWNRFHIHALTSSDPHHYVWNFVKYNMARFCAHMAFAGYIINNLQLHAKNSTKQLLCHPDKMLLLMDKDCEMMNDKNGMDGGTYIVYYVDEHGVCHPIRSGQTEKPHHERIETHKKCSMLTSKQSLESKFYRTYPSKQSTQLESLDGFEGHFEDLKFTCLSGIDSKCTDAGEIIEYEEQGLFVWTPAVKKALSRIKSDADKKTKQFLVIHYHYKVLAEMMLAPSNIVSESKGFEKLMIHHKT